MTDYEKARYEDGYLNRDVVHDRAEYRKRMTDQQFQNKLTLRALDYIRSVARILVEEIENGYPVSDALLDKVVKLNEAAFNIAHDKELKDVFQSKEI